MDNTSGQGKAAEIPDEVRGWSWGAFLMGWIWGLFNRTWIALATFIPLIGLVVWVMLGLKGREWAWRNKRWDDVEHFNRAQRKWAIAGLVIWILPVVAIVVAVFVLGMNVDMFDDAPATPTPIQAKAAAKPPAKAPVPAVAAAPQAAPAPPDATSAAPAAPAASPSALATAAAAPANAPAAVAVSAPIAPLRPAAPVAKEAKDAKDAKEPKDIKTAPAAALEKPEPAARSLLATAPEADPKPLPAPRKRTVRAPVAKPVTSATPVSAVVAEPTPQPTPRYNDIMSAVVSGDEAGVRETIAFGKFVDRRDSNGFTPLMVAVMRRESVMARLLLEAGANPRLVAMGGQSAMSIARENADTGLLALLRRYGVPDR